MLAHKHRWHRWAAVSGGEDFSNDPGRHWEKTELVSDAKVIRGMAVSTNYVFWTEYGSDDIKRVSLSGGPVESFDLSNNDGGETYNTAPFGEDFNDEPLGVRDNGLAAHGDKVYVNLKRSYYGGLLVCDEESFYCHVLKSSGLSEGQMIANDTGVFILSGSATDCLFDSDSKLVHVSSEGETTIVTDELTCPQLFAAHGDSIYLLEDSEEQSEHRSIGLSHMPIDASSPSEELLRGAINPNAGLVVNETHLLVPAYHCKEDPFQNGVYSTSSRFTYTGAVRIPTDDVSAYEIVVPPQGSILMNMLEIDHRVVMSGALSERGLQLGLVDINTGEKHIVVDDMSDVLELGGHLVSNGTHIVWSARTGVQTSQIWTAPSL